MKYSNPTDRLLRTAGKGAFTVFMFVVAGIFMLPFLLLFVTSFKKGVDIYNPFVVPNFLNWENYGLVFSTPSFFRSFFNSIMICSITMLLAIFLSGMAGYMISRGKEKIFKFTFFIFIFTLIIPAQSNMVMLYKLGVWIGMINTVPFLILIYLSGNIAYSSLIYSAFTHSIPRDFEEAAQIDGCGRFSTYFKVIFPLLSPATGTVIATEVFWYWNDFQNPLIYLNGTTTTLMMEIFNFRQIISAAVPIASTKWGPVSAICFIGTMPIVLFFLITQKHLIKGLVTGAIKG